MTTASSIPSQGGTELGPWIRSIVDSMEDGQAIVEIGPWLGAGSAQILQAIGGRDLELHLFDRWKLTHAAFARKWGLDLKPGQDFEELTRANLAPYGGKVFFHRVDVYAGSFPAWSGRPVGFYVDDACKKNPAWARAMATFRPHLVDGARLLLCDFFYGRRRGKAYQAQEFYVEQNRHAFEYLERPHASGSPAIFRYHRKP